MTLSHTTLCAAADALFAAVVAAHRVSDPVDVRIPDMLTPRAGSAAPCFTSFPANQQHAALDFLLRLGVIEKRPTPTQSTP